ncbi:MAG: hypothetical protein AB8G22_12190 [Saprospiraceae bacterium]
MRVIYVFYLLILLLSSCQNEDRKIPTSSPITNQDKSIYDGNFGQEPLTPSWLVNRNYFVLSILIQSDNKIIIDSTELSIEALPETINAYWEKVKKDNYEAVLISRLKNERGTDYDFYTKIYNLLKNSYLEQKSYLSEMKYSKGIDKLNQIELKEISKMIPIIINEAEPTGFD